MRKKGFLPFLIILMMIMVYLSFVSTEVFSEKQFTATHLTEKQLTATQWIEDIDYLNENLPKFHRNLFHDLKEEDFNKEIQNLKNNLSELNDDEITIRLAQIIAMVGDAHTSLHLDFIQNTYPIRLEWFEDDLRVIGTTILNQNLLGKKLVSINGFPVSVILEKIKSFISYENDQWLKVNNVEYIVMPEILKFLNYINQDTAEFIFNDDNGNIIKQTLIPQVLNKNYIIPIKNTLAIKPISLQQFNGENPFNNRYYWSTYVEDDKLIYFQYNKCIDYNFDDFSNGLIEQIRQNDTEKLIIDLRNNTGGNSSLMRELAIKLGKIDKIKGKIFVITGKKTFSSGLLAVMDLKKITEAMVYGEPTGSNVNHYGDIQQLILPHSKLQIIYSTKYFHISDEYKDSFIPDVTIVQSFEHYMEGIDDAYEAIRKIKY